MKKVFQGLLFLGLEFLAILSLIASIGAKTAVSNMKAAPLAITPSPMVYLPEIFKPESTATPTLVPELFFSVGLGYSDVIPHQIIRTNTDRLYIFGPSPYSTVINVYMADGLPTRPSDFALVAQVSLPSVPLSLESVYDGANIIHVLINTHAGEIRDIPFNITTNQFYSSITLASNGGTVSGDYLGTSGITGMYDKNGALHISYWTNANHILHRAYIYDNVSNILTPIGGATQVDSSGSANHPASAVSPLDNSLTVAWVSQASNPAKILVRTLSSAGVWGNIETVSTASVWTSTSAGINIDQGPSLIISADGKKHLTYIENYSGTTDYGHIHYVEGSTSGWVDQAINAYSHDPALAINSLGELFIVGHGHPLNPTCQSTSDICTIKRDASGVWGSPQLFAVHPASATFDSSPSVKWSVVGLNRPDLVEFVFFSTPYSTPTLYYGRFSTR